MPGRSRRLDPRTKDYVRNAADNGFAITTSVETHVYHALQGRRGKWWGDDEAGSYDYLIRQLNRQGVLQGVNSARTALAKLVKEGLIRDLRVEAVPSDANPTRLRRLIRFVDVSGGVIDASGIAPLGEIQEADTDGV